MKPSRTLLWMLTAMLVLGVIVGSIQALGINLPALWQSLGWGLLLALLVAAAVDALRLQRIATPEISRSLPGNLALGRWNPVQLHVSHSNARTLTLEIIDHVPEAMTVEDLPQSLELPAGKQAQLTYRVRPRQRGLFAFERCEIGMASPLKLWRARRLVALPAQTRVYPDFARLYSAQLMAVDDWLSQLGVRQKPRRGLGMEFHQLREFREGDSVRQIDWKATARKRTPIAREYMDERDQQLVFMLDCGRRMRSQDGDLAHFDHALNASLLLSYIALRQGDAVGISAFASETPRYLAPVKGAAQLNVILNSVYDLQSSQRPADYSAAVQTLLRRQRRRALVVLVSNLREEDEAELLGAVKQLSRQHRVLVASLREEILDEVRQVPVGTYDSALAYCGTVDYLNARNRLHERLTAHGVTVLDARPSELGPELVNRYLGWKKSGDL